MAILTAGSVEKRLRSLFQSPLDDAALRAEVETLAADSEFPLLVWLWGPELYRRNRTLFRPFILARFGSWRWGSDTNVEWKGEQGKALDAWLDEADRLDDAEIFRRLYTWKLLWVHNWDSKAWRQDLVHRFRAAPTSAARATTLRKMDISRLELSETTATLLYKLDPAAARPFIRNHLPTWKRGLWNDLLKEALSRGDEAFTEEIYRRLVEKQRWHADVRALCTRISDPAELCAALRRHHPAGWIWGLDPGEVFVAVLRQRGRDALPYVLRYVRDARETRWARGVHDTLLDLARAHDWTDLWASILRSAAEPREYNAEIRRLAGGPTGLPLSEEIRRLLLLAGAGREGQVRWLGNTSRTPLDDKTAVALYERFPEMVRGPFKHQLEHPVWGRSESYPRLTEKALAAGDEVLVDFLASRLATRWEVDWRTQKAKNIADAERMAGIYAGLKETDPAAFSRRAAAVLGQIPAFAIFNYGSLLRSNRLALLLFERSVEAFLEDPAALEDLLEAPEIHVQALAYRVLGTDDPRARELAGKRLDLLLATLLRPLRRVTRQLSFSALANAATVSAEHGGRILARAREAMDLPDRNYPKEQLVGLMGRILHRWPELRGPREQPAVWGSAA